MNSKIKDFFLQNLGLKLLSVVLAVLAWCGIMNMSDPNVTVTIRNITVNKTNEQAVVDENMIYAVVSGDNISISVTGPRSIVQSLQARDVNAYVDLKELSITNACPIHVSFNSSSLNSKVEVTSKSDEVMVLSLEEMITENKQVVVELSGTPSGDYYATPTVSPLMLEVYGSATQVSQIERLVAAVNIDGQTTSFITSIEVVPYDKDGNVLDSSQFTMNDNRVSVSVELMPTKTINVVINADVTAEYGFRCGNLEQAPNSITIAGPEDVIKDISDITIPYSAEGLKETISENINIMEYIPEGCYLVSNYDSISITIPVVMLNENREMSVSVSDISLKNVPAGYTLMNRSALNTISIWGAEDTTADATATELGLYVDCSSVNAPGTYSLPLGYNEDGEFMVDAATINLVFMSQ